MKYYKFFLILFVLSLIISKNIFSQETGTIHQNSSESNYLENQLYFVTEYTKNGKEIGRSNKFHISEKGGYLTAMLRTVNPIGVNSVNVKMERESSEGNATIDEQQYDVTSTKDFFFFDKVTFYLPGIYIITVLKKDGSIIALGKVEISVK